MLSGRIVSYESAIGLEIFESTAQVQDSIESTDFFFILFFCCCF